jgi:hypothetical protein
VTEFNIPHADYAFIEMRPPRKILHVVTRLPKGPGIPGFNVLSWYEMMKAIAKAKHGVQGFDAHEIHYSDDADETLP